MEMAERGIDQLNLIEFLEKYGLQPSKWLPFFHREQVSKPDHILAIKGSHSHYQKLSSNATNKKEEHALMKLLEITEATSSPDDQIETKLVEAGLEPNFWLKILKNEVGVTSLNALKNLGEESYSTLLQFVQYPWERKILRKLLGMSDDVMSFKVQREKRREKFQQRQEESWKMLQQLKGLQKEGKERHDNVVQVVESGIRESLQISPDAWIPCDTNLETTICTLESSIGKLDQALQSRLELSDIHVLENASGGLALQGILLSRNFDDQVQSRGKLLKPSDDIQLMGPSLSSCQREEIFSSQAKESHFQKAMDKLGYSASVSAKDGFWGISFEIGGGFSKTSESDKTNEYHKEELYSSVIKYSFVPLASIYFSDSQLFLSSEAIKKLKILENLIASKRTADVIQDECQRFFQQFGSHVNKGHLHFGGIYWCKSISKGFEQNELETIKRLQREIVDMQAGVSYGYAFGASAEANKSKIDSSFSGRFSKEIISKTTMEVFTTGGPPEVSNLPQWRSGMVANNSTWSLIDRGTDVVPIWDIIQINHRRNFQNPNEIIKTLCQAWQILTNLNADSSTTEQLFQDEDAAEAFIVIDSWIDERDESKYAQHLDKLLSVKQGVVNRSMNLQAWPEHYLSHPSVQKFLHLVMEAKRDTSSNDTEYIKLLMKQIIKPSHVNDLSDISDWLYHSDTAENVVKLECTDMATLRMFVDINLDAMTLAKAKSSLLYEESHEEQRLKIRTSAIISKAVNYLCISFKEAKQKYEELLLLTLLFPCQYDVFQRIFRQLLSINDLKYLQTVLQQNKAFCDTSLMKVQASLFHLTVKMYHREDIDVAETQIRAHVKFLESEMKGDIDPHVESVLIQLQSSKRDWKNISLQLASLEKGIMKDKGEGNQLIDILSTSGANATPPSLKAASGSHMSAKPSGKVYDLFKKLGLLDFYPQGLKMNDALMIRQETLGDEQCNNLELLPYFILQKLLMHDYQCRSVLFQQKIPSVKVSLAESQQQYDDFDDFDDFWDASSSSKGALSEIHPMDGILALLHCSDNFLRQDLMARLSTCQLAIPFLLPDPTTDTIMLPLFAMHTIVKEWKCTNIQTGKTKSDGCRIVTHQTPIVSFYRLTSQRSEFSKSRLLNEVVSDSPHNYFFHFHCDGGSTTPLLTDGLVELCWYLPAGKSKDPFTQVIAFTNLHGEVSSHPIQTKFLSEVSFMNFVLLTEDDLDENGIKIIQDLAKAPGGAVLMFIDKNFTQPERMKSLMGSIPRSQCYRMKLSGKSSADIKTSVREQINAKLGSCKREFMTAVTCAKVARDLKIKVDEDDPECVQGKELACGIQKVLAEMESTDKDSVLPLQSQKLWHEWAMHDKERHRHINKGAKGIEQYNSEKEHDKLMIRMLQLSTAENPTPVMKAFLCNIIQYTGYVRDYFLRWLQFILDDHSRKKLPQVFHRYQEVRMQLLKLQRQHKIGREDAKGPLREQLSQLNDKLIHASFGLEHLLREVGQIYEATVELKNVSPQLRLLVNHLPEVAAELLISGYPLELMNGDASHVPLCWVMAVLDEVEKQLSGKHLFVLSILGIQSSGKSTLLNTMFGLRFTVSAGRCTRGAFIQLLPFNETLKEKIGCDYLLIVDTEGLRTPELSSQETQKHDNELATFVIGLANVTLVNIFGEAPGDMDDILQRAVHAFIRMEHVGLKPSCQFIHQNVGAISGASRGMMGRVNFQEKLNTMTKAAAEEEGLGGHYTMFSHVINFDEERDVWYFPGLWKGDPPMAPVNPGYSDGAHQLKSGLVEIATGHRLFSAFKTRIRDLWKAILHENFIFSFKNTLEITAYNQLDANYAQWSWEFQTEMLKWQERSKHRINSTKIDELNGLKGILLNEVSRVGSDTLAEIQTKMKKFFEDSEQRHIVAQWQRRTEKRLEDVKIEHETDARHQCTALISGRQALANADSMKQRRQEELRVLVKALASNLEKGQLKDKELDELYEEKWLEWMTDLKSSREIDQSKPDIIGSLEHSLRELFATHHNLLNPKLTTASLRKRKSKSMTLEIVPNTHITANRAWSVGKVLKGESNLMALVKPQHVEAAQVETNTFFVQVQEYLDENKNQNFKQAFGHELLKDLLGEIVEAQKRHPEFNFTPEYKVDIALIVCGYALPKFEGMAERFRKQNDPVEYLEREMKIPFRRLFKSQYKQTAQEIAAAVNLCERLIKSIEAALKESLAHKIAVDVRSSSDCFSTKRALKAKILADLAEKQCFDEYALYLKDVKRSVRTWIKRYTDQHCKQTSRRRSRFTELAEIELERLVVSISRAAKTITHLFPKDGIESWLNKFHGKLITELSLDLGEMQKVVGDLKDLDNFTEELCKKLGDLSINQFSISNIEEWDNQPYDILFNALAGCCEQCPFCNEQCELTDSNHSGKHSVILHRSVCLGGWRKYRSKKMVLTTCNALVASSSHFYYHDVDGQKKRHPYSRFQEVPRFSSWTISPDSSLETALYWKWFLATYTTEVAGLYKMKETDIPWKSFTKEDAQEDLKLIYYKI